MNLVFIFRKNLPVASEFSFEILDDSFLCFRLSLLHSVRYLVFLYCYPSSQDGRILDKLSDTIDMTISKLICDHLWRLYAHHVKWLYHSNATDVVGIQTFNNSIQDSIQIDFPILFPIFIQCFFTCSSGSDRALVSVYISFEILLERKLFCSSCFKNSGEPPDVLKYQLISLLPQFSQRKKKL